MRAVLVLDLQALAARQKSIAMQREIGGRVIENVVPALLRFEQKRESRVADDVDPVDRVHLNGNAKGHVEALDPKGVLRTAVSRWSFSVI